MIESIVPAKMYVYALFINFQHADLVIITCSFVNKGNKLNLMV